LYRIRDDVNLASMKRLGVITVNERGLYPEVQRYIAGKNITPTDFFYDKIEKSTYHAGENPILSYNDDSNLIVAKKDSDAIFLYSENQILSPTQFINLFVNLYDSAKNASLELERKTYSSFELGDLNLNFADIILATGAKSEFMQQYDSNLKSVNNTENIYESSLNGVKAIYDFQDEAAIYTHTSQHGINLVRFLDTMINLNPDIRLLMSNTVISPYRSTLVDTFLHTVRNNYSSYKNYSNMEIARDIDAFIKSGKPFEDKEQEEFFEVFRKEQDISNHRISKSNNSYKVFPALKYVLESQQKDGEEKEDLDIKYILKWYEGDPDNGVRAINYALGIMSDTKRMEREPGAVACRNLQSVKDYMGNIKNKAVELNMGIKRKESKNKEDK